MKLPTAQERQSILDEKARKDAEYARKKQEEADAIVAAALRLREERIVELLGQIEGAVIGALAYGKDHAYVRIADGREWASENLLIGNEICRRAKLVAPEYVFSLDVENWSYTDNEKDNDGYPSGREFWVNKYWQSIKVTWPEPETPANVPVEPEVIDFSSMTEQPYPEEGERNPTWEEMFTPEELAEMREPATPDTYYAIDLANFDSELPDQFISKFDVPPTKAMILEAIDRLRKVFADHYVDGGEKEAEAGCCGPEICILDGDKLVAFIKITAEEEDE